MSLTNGTVADESVSLVDTSKMALD